MDSKAFDKWTRTRAAATDRRTLLGWSLAAGVAGALARVLPASAQFGGGGNGTCTYQITLTSSLDAGATAAGTLTIDIGDGGAIDTGSLALTGQAPASVVGQATGPAIDLLASLGDGTTLSLTGVAAGPISNCSDPIQGSLANADNGQVGTWQTAASPSSGSSTQASSGGQTSTGSSSGSSSTSGTGSNAGNGSGSSNGNGSSGGACLELHSQCNTGSECCSGWCTDNECRSCGDTICGDDCAVLSDNIAHCGACFSACNADTQTCVNGVCTGGDGSSGGCIVMGGACNFGGQCCSGFCNGGSCDSCSGVVCNEMCVNTGTDNNNCGNCNNMCIGTTCQNGSCQ